MQALILAGGEGTRLRPLTSTIPKPVVPLVNQPFIAYMLEWLRGHGVDDVILGCGFMAGGVRSVLGDGSSLGLRLRYLEEPKPLGTGGALKFAEDLLDERFLMLNGDVLCDLDLTAQLEAHARTGARATLGLIGVEDPSAYGLVRLAEDGSVREFLEKPSAEEIDTKLINAGCYVLERGVLDGMAPSGTRISIERDVFPTLVGAGLYGFEAHGYWMDIGTPERYLQGTYDILEGQLCTEVGRRLEAAGRVLADGASIAGDVVGPAVIGPGSVLAAGASVGSRAVLGCNVRVASGATIAGSALLDDVLVGEGVTINASIVGVGVEIGAGCVIEEGAVLGAGVKLGPGNVLRAGVRIFPSVQLPEGAIKF